MTIKLRLYLLLAIPALIILIYSLLIIKDSQGQAAEMTRIGTMAELGVKISALIHEQQIERGRTGGFIGAQGQKFKSELLNQRRSTDEKLQNLRTYLGTLDKDLLTVDGKKHLSDAIDRLGGLGILREQVDTLTISGLDALDTYTKNNTKLLDVIDSTTLATTDAAIGRKIAAYSAFLKAKDRAGIERAVLSYTFNRDQFEGGRLTLFTSLVAIQETYFEQFLASADKEAVSLYQKVITSKPFSDVEAFRAIAREKASTGGFNIDSSQWFNTVTQKINLLKETEDALSDSLVAVANQGRNEANQTVQLAIIISLVVSAVVIFFAFRLIKTITTPISILDRTVHRVTDGDLEARTGLNSADELGTLGKSFDNLLNERITTGQKAELENEQLNNSIVNLIRAVSEISRHDFTIQIPVSADVTGAVSDSLNLLTNQLSVALNAMKTISEDVSEVSSNVNKQSDNVLILAEQGRISVDDTAATLNTAAEEMRKISSEAKDAREFADTTIKVTEQAFDIVNQSAGGINAIRDTISETEKRIKRLGERSQEISGIVNIINSIAERTHILALNASMHAASAGEAGRGFAVVADEVQRLAENAREATAEITILVNNIRVETADTAAVMNVAITQVAEGTRLAEQAGQSMQAAQNTTAQLVNAVMNISGSATGQAEIANELQEKAIEIQDSTRKTATELNDQKKNTDSLVSFSEKLAEQVNVFKLKISA